VTWVGLLLLAMGGFLVGGMVSAWRTSRRLAVVLAIGAALATASGVAWML
jgi:cbb3-type cytochrome oxidase subunit 3